MTTRIQLFNADNENIGSISSTTLAALIDSGLLNRENTPAASLTPTNAPCIECEHPRSVGIFCMCCFTRLRTCSPEWAAAWYGASWDEAVKLAERVEVAL